MASDSILCIGMDPLGDRFIQVVLSTDLTDLRGNAL